MTATKTTARAAPGCSRASAKHRWPGVFRTLGFTLLALLAGAASAQTELLLKDQSGQALPGAVVWAGDTLARPANDGTAPTNIDQRDKRFAPYVSVTRPGAKVYFPNSDDIRHHVYSFSRGNNFERKLYRADEAAPVAFATAGVVALGCNIHDNMQAYVIVSDQQAAVSDDQGRIAFSATPRTLRIWHPLLLEEELRVDWADLETLAGDVRTLSLPVFWEDPQAPRSNSDLESLLKQFSKDAS